MLCPDWSLEGSSVEKTQLKEWLVYFHTQEYVRRGLQVSASRIEVQVQLLTTNADWDQVLDVVWVRGGSDGAILALPRGGDLVDEGVRELLGGLQAELLVSLQHGSSSIASVLGVVDCGDAEGAAGTLLSGSSLGGHGQGEQGGEGVHLGGQED